MRARRKRGRRRSRIKSGQVREMHYPIRTEGVGLMILIGTGCLPPLLLRGVHRMHTHIRLITEDTCRILLQSLQQQDGLARRQLQRVRAQERIYLLLPTTSHRLIQVSTFLHTILYIRRHRLLQFTYLEYQVKTKWMEEQMMSSKCDLLMPKCHHHTSVMNIHLILRHLINFPAACIILLATCHIILRQKVVLRLPILTAQLRITITINLGLVLPILFPPILFIKAMLIVSSTLSEKTHINSLLFNLQMSREWTTQYCLDTVQMYVYMYKNIRRQQLSSIHDNSVNAYK